MRSTAVVLLLAGFAAALPLHAGDADSHISSKELSRRTAALAEELYGDETKLAQRLRKLAAERGPRNGDAGEGVDSILYDDVLNLLDAALIADTDNLHARALAADVLLAKAREAKGMYEICSLLDARDQIDYVLANADDATPADIQAVKRINSTIDAIPTDKIEGKESDCDGDDDSTSTAFHVNRLRSN